MRIQRLLIANRGEIARRIAHTARRRGPRRILVIPPFFWRSGSMLHVM
ncbi:biotin carboxylase N-terminal domain-containing protein [Desmospora activa]|nr:biotin carboxylase N-terminal domain-containing protein [Desmospora activa]